MAESAVSFLLDNLSALISKERQLLGSLGHSAEFIRDEMGRMRAFLRVADEKQDSDPQLKEWVNQVRNVAYDAEDLMDKFMLRFSGQRTNGFNQIYASLRNLKACRRLASEMLAIELRVKRVSEGQQRYKEIYGGATSDRDSGLTGTTWYDSRSDALLLEEAEVVGIQKPKTQLLQWLSNSTDGLKVISVVGTGGLGKTTLVKKVYDDVTVKTRFTTHVWMTVSNSFRLEGLLGTMIRRLVTEVKQPTPEGLEAMDADEMKQFIYKFLQDRSYIIVLDDIWRLNAWEAIRYAFPRSGTRGFIIITTRFQSIGHSASIESNGHLYGLEPLSQEQSKTLFCRKAFLGGSCPAYLEGISGDVLRKCEGLPLAIVVIGSLLATKNSNFEEWQKIHRSLGNEIEGDHLSAMMKLLSLSFYDLPYYLKSCFLYLSIFPEDSIVYSIRVIRMWIAEGFIQAREGKTLEEVGQEYVKELSDRSLIQLAQTPHYDGSIRIRVHDLLHTMIVSKSKEQNLVTVSNGGDQQYWPAKIRRLAIHGSTNDMTSSSNDMTDTKNCDHLRSLLMVGSNHQQSEVNLSNLLKNTSRQLKVLELRGFTSSTSSGKIPEEIFKLYCLRYLGLKNTHINYVSRLIGKLENLETLDLRDTDVRELPAEILRLRKLRHLMVYHYRLDRGYRPFHNAHSCKIPYKIGCLSSLRTLSDVDATQADDTTIAREIGKLTQLKKLGVMKMRKEDGKDLCVSLTKLRSLESLHIAAIEEDEILDLQDPVSPAPRIRSLELRGRLLKVPQWIPSLQGLTKLLLRWSRINGEDPLDSLQHLPNLMHLELCHTYEGNGLCFKSSGFQRLKKLWLIGLSGLKLVKVEEGSIPLLQELYIWGCKLVEDVPLGIEYLSDLQYIDFSDMSEGFVTALEKQKEGGDTWRLAYVPKIEIYSLAGGEWHGRQLVG